MYFLFFYIWRLTLRIYSASKWDLKDRFANSKLSKFVSNPYILLIFTTICAVFNISSDKHTIHFVIVSATYYKTSPIYKPETVIILLNGPDQHRFNRAITCAAEGEDENDIRFTPAVFRYAYDPVGICKWTAYIAECSVFEGFKKLYFTRGSSKTKMIEIPVRRPYQPTKNQTAIEVANCFSPFFYNEHWQLVLTSLELYRHFGSQLQVYYVQSMLESITDVLEKYQDIGLVELEPWASFKLGFEAIEKIGFDPNFELDWRNQASAHTDCFLKYKDVAQFIIFGDVDDVLIPKVGATYLHEFNFLSNIYSNAAGLTYNRYNTALESNVHIEQFSIFNSIRGARVAKEWEDGKYVVNTSRVETAWLHYPGIYNKETLQMYTVPENRNIMLHLRNWTFSQVNSSDGIKSTPALLSPNTPLFKTQISDLINVDAIHTIESKFRKFSSEHTELFQILPTRNYYLPIIIECYDRIFYSRSRHPDSCPGPLKCKIPAIKNLKCSVAVRQHISQPMNWRTTFYTAPSEAKFLSSKNGCYLG